MDFRKYELCHPLKKIEISRRFFRCPPTVDDTPLSKKMADLPINEYALTFTLLQKFNDIELNQTQRVMLNQPSGLTDVALIRHYWNDGVEILDFRGTTNKEAIEKILGFYKKKSDRKYLGCHLFFEGFHMHDNTAFIQLGS